jgi:hypothetical protein
VTDLPERSGAQIASRSIDTTVGGQPASLPVLVTGRNREWINRFRSSVDELLGGVASQPVDSVGALANYGALTLDRMGELVKAYDESGALGPGYPDNAYPAEVHETFRKVLSAAFPFGQDLETLLPQLRAVLVRQMAAMASGAPTSPSQPSTDGRPSRSKKT